MSPAPPMQCGKCVKRNSADRMVKMDLSSKEKGKSHMYFDKDRLGDLFSRKKGKDVDLNLLC